MARLLAKDSNDSKLMMNTAIGLTDAKFSINEIDDSIKIGKIKLSEGKNEEALEKLSNAVETLKCLLVDKENDINENCSAYQHDNSFSSITINSMGTNSDSFSVEMSISDEPRDFPTRDDNDLDGGSSSHPPIPTRICKYSIATTLHNIAVAYKRMKLYEKSIRTFLEALRFYHESFQQIEKQNQGQATLFENGSIDHAIRLSETLFAMAQVHQIQNNIQDAMSCYKRIIALLTKNVVYNNQSLVTESNMTQVLVSNLLSQSSLSFSSSFSSFSECDSSCSIFTSSSDPKLQKRLLMLATTVSEMGNIYVAKVKYNSAIRSFQKALKIYTACEPFYSSTQSNSSLEYNETSIQLKKTIANTHTQIGIIRFKQKKLDEAIQSWRESLQLYLELADGDETDVSVVSALNNVGIAHLHREEYDGALQCFEMVYYVRYQQHCEDHPDLANLLYNLGTVHHKKGSLKEALNFYWDAMRIYWSTAETCIPADENHRKLILRKIACVARDLGGIHIKTGQINIGIKVYEDASKIYRTVDGPNHLEVGRISQKLGEIFSRTKQAEEASKYLTDALNIYKVNLPEDDPACITVKTILNFMKQELSRQQLLKQDFGESPIKEKDSNQNKIELPSKMPVENKKREQPNLKYIMFNDADTHISDAVSQITFQTSDILHKQNDEWVKLNTVIKFEESKQGKTQNEDNSTDWLTSLYPSTSNRCKDAKPSKHIDLKELSSNASGLKTLKNEGKELAVDSSISKSKDGNHDALKKIDECSHTIGNEENHAITVDLQEQHPKNEEDSIFDIQNDLITTTEKLNGDTVEIKKTVVPTEKLQSHEKHQKVRGKPKCFHLYGVMPEGGHQFAEEEKSSIEMSESNFDELLGNMIVVHGEMDSNDLAKPFAQVLKVEKLSSQYEAGAYDVLGKNIIDEWNSEIQLLSKELSLQISNYGDHPKVAETITRIATLYVKKKELDRAMGLYREALRVQKKTLGSGSVEVASTLCNIGDIYSRQRAYALSLQYHKEALSIKSAKLGEFHPDVGHILNYMGHVYSKSGDFEYAMDYHRHALSILSNVLGENHFVVIRTLGYIGTVFFKKRKMFGSPKLSVTKSTQRKNTVQKIMVDNLIEISMFYKIGIAYMKMSLYAMAMKVLKEILNIQQKHNENPQIITLTLNNIGQVYRHKGKYDEALTYHHEALFMLKESCKENDKYSIEWTNVLIGMNEYHKGNYSKAMRIYEEALPILKSSIVINASRVAIVLQSMSDVKAKLGEYSASMTLLRDALKVQNNLVQNDLETISTKIKMGHIYAKQGKYDDALELLNEVRVMQNELLSPVHCLVADALHNLGTAYGISGDHVTAMKMYQDAFNMRRNLLGENHTDVANTLGSIGVVHINNGKPARALRAFDDVLRVQRELLGSKHLDVARTLNNMGISYSKMKNYDQAKSNYEEALNIIKDVLGVKHKMVADTQVLLGKAFLRKCEYSEAKKVLNRALEVYRLYKLGPNDPKIVDLNESLNRAEHEELLCV